MLISSWVRAACCSGKEADLIWAKKSKFFCWKIWTMENLVRQLCPARFLFFVWRCPKILAASVQIDSCSSDTVSAKVAHIWSLWLTLSSSCVHHSSVELPHARGVFKHRFLRKSLSVVWWELVVWVLSWLRSSIWSFTAPQGKEISSRTTLQSFRWVEMDKLLTKGVAVCFCKSFEFPPWFRVG